MNVKITDNIPEIKHQAVSYVDATNLEQTFNILREFTDTIGSIYKHYYDEDDNNLYLLYFNKASGYSELAMYGGPTMDDMIFKASYSSGTNEFTTIGFLPPTAAVAYIVTLKSGDFTDEEVARFDQYSQVLDLKISYNVLYLWAYKCIDKLKKINTKLDYMLRLPSEVISPSVSFTSNISGITTTTNTSIVARLVGNYLYIFHQMTLTSAAQTSVGTGNLTAKLIGTYTFSNFVLTDSSIDNNTNLQKISSKTPKDSSFEVSSNSGYSSGNAQPASFFWRSSISGTTLTVQLYVKAVKTATTNWQLGVLIPVLRVPPYTG